MKDVIKTVHLPSDVQSEFYYRMRTLCAQKNIPSCHVWVPLHPYCLDHVFKPSKVRSILDTKWWLANRIHWQPGLIEDSSIHSQLPPPNPAHTRGVCTNSMEARETWAPAVTLPAAEKTAIFDPLTANQDASVAFEIIMQNDSTIVL